MIGLVWLTAWDQVLDLETVVVDDELEAFSGTVAEREEGDVIVPYYTVSIRNPGIGGIAARPGRYAAVVERDPATGVAEEHARGRLTGLPTELGAADCTMEFLCVPPDEDDVLQATANTHRIGEIDYDPAAPLADREAAEMYDPLFFDADATEDPTTVLLARRHLWRWDRKTLLPTLVHLTDGVVEHQVNDLIEGTLSLRVTTPPKAITKLRLIASWTQYAKDIQDSNRLGSFSSFTYQDVLSSIPKPGDSIGADTGWTFDSFDVFSFPHPLTFRVKADSPEYGDAAGGHLELRPQIISYSWRAAFDYEQARQEIIDISMPAAVQDVLGDAKTETVEVLNLGQLNLDLTTPEWEFEDPDTLEVRHYAVGDRVQANGRCYVCVHAHYASETFGVFDESDEILWEVTTKNAALRDMRTARFADLDRGVRALRYAIRRLDRQVCLRSRAAEISFEVPWETAKSMTTADTARVEHRLIPGGEAVGKITGVELRIGSSRSGRITILAPIGDGSTPPVADDGQQSAGDVVYTVNFGRLNEPVDALALGGMAPYVNEIVHNADEQKAAATTASFGNLDPMAAIGALPTQYHIGFPSLRQEDLLRRRVSVTCLPTHVPKGIDIAPDLGEP
ncbi:hypothetical protein [Neorhizobium tomejilense]|uniref:hypothetical protein n=1 Tax=Neorhizobium tomejilense TaxID=2093828 RepID=UPI003ED08920